MIKIRAAKIRPYLMIGTCLLLFLAIWSVNGTISLANAAKTTITLVPTRRAAATQRACPDTARPITTATATLVNTATATKPNATPATPGPQTVASSFIRNIQDLILANPQPTPQPGQTPLPPNRYDIIHSIVEY